MFLGFSGHGSVGRGTHEKVGRDGSQKSHHLLKRDTAAQSQSEAILLGENRIGEGTLNKESCLSSNLHNDAIAKKKPSMQRGREGQ